MGPTEFLVDGCPILPILHSCRHEGEDDPKCDTPHTETEQAAYYNAILSLSEAAHIAGYALWTLNDFSQIIPGDKESHHCQGVLRNSLVDRCEEGNPKDYSRKPAAGKVQRHNLDTIAYLDEFDGWADQNIDDPPPGWNDNRDQGGGQLIGYAQEHPKKSHRPSHVAFYKLGSIANGLAMSPVLVDVDIDRHPYLRIKVSNREVRDVENNDTSEVILHLGVEQNDRIQRLREIGTEGTFSVDLRRPPTNWSGMQTFRIVLELDPAVDDAIGYSVVYELDWIGLAGDQPEFLYLPSRGGWRAILPVVEKRTYPQNYRVSQCLTM
jgi:hypothetical protein